MVKTTVNIEDEIYKRLLKESIEKYGKARSFSKLINEKLRVATSGTHSIESSEIKSRLEVVRRSAGSWKIKETGAEYVRKIRRESERRLKRMGL